jgi:hypothetical protein
MMRYRGTLDISVYLLIYPLTWHRGISYRLDIRRHDTALEGGVIPDRHRVGRVLLVCTCISAYRLASPKGEYGRVMERRVWASSAPRLVHRAMVQ